MTTKAILATIAVVVCIGYIANGMLLANGFSDAKATPKQASLEVQEPIYVFLSTEEIVGVWLESLKADQQGQSNTLWVKTVHVDEDGYKLEAQQSEELGLQLDWQNLTASSIDGLNYLMTLPIVTTNGQNADEVFANASRANCVELRQLLNQQVLQLNGFIQDRQSGASLKLVTDPICPGN